MRIMLKNQMELLNELTSLINQAQPVPIKSYENKFDITSQYSPRINVIE